MTETANDSTPISVAMLIDDERVDQMVYRRIVKRSGLIREAISFQYAEEALDYLKSPDREPIDVIFLDINMPRMNGFEFLDAAVNELGEDFARAVIIMLTTSLDANDRERAARYSVVRDYFNKPLSVEHIAKVASMLEDAEPI